MVYSLERYNSERLNGELVFVSTNVYAGVRNFRALDSYIISAGGDKIQIDYECISSDLNLGDYVSHNGYILKVQSVLESFNGENKIKLVKLKKQN